MKRKLTDAEKNMREWIKQHNKRKWADIKRRKKFVPLPAHQEVTLK